MHRDKSKTPMLEAKQKVLLKSLGHIHLFSKISNFLRLSGHAAGSFQGQRPTFHEWVQTLVPHGFGTGFWTQPLTTVIGGSMGWAIWAE